MSTPDEQQRAADFILAELRGEGVDIAPEVVAGAATTIEAMSFAQAVPPPPGHQVEQAKGKIRIGDCDSFKEELSSSPPIPDPYSLQTSRSWPSPRLYSGISKVQSKAREKAESFNNK